MNQHGMRRDLSRFTDRTFDLLVVGGGIHGAAIAWDASLRGLSVALVDRGDFGAATSAKSLRIIHGGLRYLARADFPRMLESIRERSTLLRIAPDLVEPLPVLVPTYAGLPLRRSALRLGLLLNDLISAGRNRGLPPDRQIPPGRLVSRAETSELFPWVLRDHLTGGAFWYDALMRHPERLTLAFVRSAAERGAEVANYVRVNRLLVRNGQAEGASVTDLESGSRLEIRARTTVVAAGPWTGALISGTLEPGARPGPGQALALNIVISRPLSRVAVGVHARSGADQDRLFGGNRYLFTVPQGGRSLLGTWYARAEDRAATPKIGAQSLLEAFNRACPGLDLSARDVLGCHWGWLPLEESRERARVTGLAERPRIIDQGRGGRARHLLSVEGVKYTTARSVAEGIVDWVFRNMGKSPPRCRTHEVPLSSGKESLDEVAVHNAVRQDMALKLSDIVFRRTSMSASPLTRSTLAATARLAGAELGWDALRQESEVEEVMRELEGFRATEEPVG
jgi:glycerol-3-phosphate dehydrogenase